MTPKAVIQVATMTVLAEAHATNADKAEGIKGEGANLVMGAGKQGQVDPKARQPTNLLIFMSQ
jgi:hypothetical protein